MQYKVLTQASLESLLENLMIFFHTQAFCCIGTGALGTPYQYYCGRDHWLSFDYAAFPKEEAAHVALKTTREWLEVNADKVSSNS